MQNLPPNDKRVQMSDNVNNAVNCLESHLQIVMVKLVFVKGDYTLIRVTSPLRLSYIYDVKTYPLARFPQ